jgi:tricorn protease-like protein
LKYAGRTAGFLTVVAGLGCLIIWISGIPTALFAKTSTPTLEPTLTATETSTPGPKGTPTYTPVVASSWQQGKMVYVRRDAANSYHLDMLDFTKSDRPEVLLSPERPRESRYYSPWLTLDGTSLVFDDLYQGEIYFFDLEIAEGPHFIDNCAAASVAPDGRRVVCYLSGADYFPIYDVQTGEMVSTLNHGMDGAVIPVWSPDGSEIAFSILEGNQKSSIWKVPVDGGNPIPLATDANEDYTPMWSPDGEWITFQSTLTSESSEVWIMRSDGSERKQLTFSGGDSKWSRGPCFSPDGQWLAFVSNRDGGEGSDFGEVFVLSLLSEELIKVTDTGGRILDFRVTWGG